MPDGVEVKGVLKRVELLPASDNPKWNKSKGCLLIALQILKGFQPLQLSLEPCSWTGKLDLWAVRNPFIVNSARSFLGLI